MSTGSPAAQSHSPGSVTVFWASCPTRCSSLDRSDHATQVPFSNLPSGSLFQSWSFSPHPHLELCYLESPPNYTSFEDKIPDLFLTPPAPSPDQDHRPVLALFLLETLSPLSALCSLPISLSAPLLPPLPRRSPTRCTGCVRFCPCPSPPHPPLLGNPTRIMGRRGLSTDDSPTSPPSANSLLSSSAAFLVTWPSTHQVSTGTQSVSPQLCFLQAPHFCQEYLNHPGSRF